MKAEVDQIFVVSSEVFTVTLTFIGVLRGLLGPLPRSIAVFLVEFVRFNFSMNIGLLNVSHIIQFFIIYDMR